MPLLKYWDGAAWQELGTASGNPLSVIGDLSLNYDTDNDGVGVLSSNSGPDRVLTLENNGQLRTQMAATPSQGQLLFGNAGSPSWLYGDANNIAARQAGSFYVQNQAGSASWHQFSGTAAVHYTAQLILDAGTSPQFYTNQGSGNPGYTFGFFNSPANAAAAGIKVGSLVVSDSYGDSASLTNAFVKGTLNAAGQVRSPTLYAYGSGAALITQDRSTGYDWYWYGTATSETAQHAIRLYNNADGDLLLVNKAENLSGVTVRSAATPPGSVIFYAQTAMLAENIFYDGSGFTGYDNSYAAGFFYVQGGTGVFQKKAAGASYGSTFVTFGAASYALDVNGALHYVSASASSDRKLKKNVKDLDKGALAHVRAMRPVSFDWNAEAEKVGYTAEHGVTGRHVGLIAQDLQEHYPELVKEWQPTPGWRAPDDDSPVQEQPTYYGIDYERLGVVTLAAVQELADEVDKLRQQIKGGGP